MPENRAAPIPENTMVSAPELNNEPPEENTASAGPEHIVGSAPVYAIFAAPKYVGDPSTEIIAEPMPTVVTETLRERALEPAPEYTVITASKHGRRAKSKKSKGKDATPAPPQSPQDSPKPPQSPKSSPKPLQSPMASPAPASGEEGYNETSGADRMDALPVTSVWRDLGSLMIKIGVIAVIAVVIFTFVYGLHHNLDSSMLPAVKDGDLVLFYRWDKDYRPGDLILVKFQGQTQVRRVIATAGDKVDITEEGLFINGALQQEREIFRKTERYADGVDMPLTVGHDQVFVLGDARDGVTDSRIYGAMDTDDALGKVISVLRRRNL